LYASVLSERSGTGQPSRVQKGKGHYGQLKKKEGRMCALFVDFRAAFDKVDTEKIFVCMRERERERERKKNKRIAGAEGQGDIRENKEQGKDGREKRG
jgi:hypothetical protein